MLNSLRKSITGISRCNSLKGSDYRKGVTRLGSSDCDSGRCSKHNMWVKGSLQTAENTYLQPSKKQIEMRKFEIQKPIVEPRIDYDQEEHCRKMEECKKESAKASSKKKK